MCIQLSFFKNFRNFSGENDLSIAGRPVLLFAKSGHYCTLETPFISEYSQQPQEIMATVLTLPMSKPGTE